MEGLDLTDWTQGLLVEQSSIQCSPPKHPLAQVTLKDGNTQRVTALGRTGSNATAAVIKPAVPIAHAVPEAPPAPAEGSHADAENDAGSPAAAADEAPGSVPRRTHTPGRTGLTARAVRMPSRLGPTPGAKLPDQFVVPASTKTAGKATAAVAPPTAGGGGHLKSILKRLNFSTTKGRRGTAATAPAGEASMPPATEPVRQPAGAAAAAESTIKQLRFDMSTTPATATAAQPAGGRHVSFDAATVSPQARGRPSAPPSAGALPAWGTPEPTIPEEDSAGSSGSDGGDGGTPQGRGSVNSARAGHTPYDRRLSSLFHKYQVAGTPELPDAELDALVAAGAVSSPSWNRLSSASVPESIRQLSKRYTSDAEGSSPAALTPAAAAAGDAAQAATPVQARAGDAGRSPTLEPTPHGLLDTIMRRNEVYESPPAADAVAAAGLTPQPATADAAAGAGMTAQAGPDAPLSPASMVAQLLGPVLRLAIDDIAAGQAAPQAERADASPTAAAAPGAAPGTRPADSLSSPAEFYGFPAMAAPGSGSEPRSSYSSVPRDAEGVPILTPATVTVRRGGYSGSRVPMLEDDGLAANLFDSTFSPGDSQDGFGASPGASQGGFGGSPGGGAVQESGGFGGRRSSQQAEAASTPGSAGAEFSFFPTTAAGAASASATGATPELALAGSAGNTISPEILGYYEQQQAVQRQVAASTTATLGAASTPAVPRSIIKSGRPLNEAGTPVLGRAQRPGAGDAPPPTITRELQALMQDLRLEDASELEQMGTVPALSSVRATGKLRGFLDGLSRAITPVRRSARTRTPAKPLQTMLEETGYSYVPNAALMAEDAQPKVEAAEAKAARQAASQAGGQASAQPSFSAGVAEQGQPEVSSTAPSARRYSTRSAAQAGATTPAHTGDDARTPAAPAGDAPPPEAFTTASQLGLHALRTSQRGAATPGGASTPACAPLGTPAADVPVAQDASPQLGESPSFGGSTAGNTPLRSYSFRLSTLNKAARQSTPGTPCALPAASPGAEGGTKEAARGASTPHQLSPTEQGIRASLRRSARKSRAAK